MKKKGERGRGDGGVSRVHDCAYTQQMRRGRGKKGRKNDDNSNNNYAHPPQLKHPRAPAIGMKVLIQFDITRLRLDERTAKSKWEPIEKYRLAKKMGLEERT